MPIVYLLVIIISFSYDHIVNNKTYKHVLVAIFISIYVTISINLQLQHKQSTAIAQLANHLKDSDTSYTIISNPLINYYLSSTGNIYTYIDTQASIHFDRIKPPDNRHKIIMVGDYQELIGDKYKIYNDTTFYHNPYVNRMWSTIKVYSLIK